MIWLISLNKNSRIAYDSVRQLMSAFPTRFLLSAPTFRSSRKIVRMMHARFLVVVRCVQCIDNARPRSGSRLVVVRLFPRSREDESNLIIYCYLALKLFDRLRRFGNWSQLDLRKRFFFSISIKRTYDKGILCLIDRERFLSSFLL